MAKNILLVEDDSFIVDIYSTYFKREGYNVSIAGDGDMALEKIKNHQPDLLVLDIGLPKKDGWEVLRILRNDPVTKDLKVVVISNNSRQECEENIERFGVIKYFLKVQTAPEEIMSVVKEILK